MSSDPLADTQPIQRHGKSWRWLLWLFLAVCLMALSSVSGALAGYWSGRQQVMRQRVMNAAIAIQQQYLLGLEDMRAGRYDMARQRLEYVLSSDPSFPGAADQLAAAMRILYATATPSPIPPSPTPSPTPDMAPLEEIYARIWSAFQSGDWDGVINNVLALRQRDLTYNVVAVDDLLYQALRNRGVARISRGNDLQGGNYDLSLAERFGPVDAVAQNWRNLARLYLIGSGFWEVDPAQAVYYFGMVAAAAPYLRDASGWTASERYRASLIQYGDVLAAKGDVCAAQDQYNLALSYRRDAALESRATAVAAQCLLATQALFTPTATFPFTPTPTETPTLMLTTIVPATTAVPPSSTFTPSAPISPTDTPTATSLPSPTPSPSATPQAGETPTPSTPSGG